MASRPKRSDGLTRRVLRAPLTCYRIADPRFPVVDGTGAALVGGRWNSVGEPVVYASLSFSGAIVEQLAHSGIGQLPPRVFVTITLPRGVRVCEPLPVALRGWDDDDCVASRRIGRAWLREASAVALIVPSKTAAPIERHVLLNPLHADFHSLDISAPEVLVWGARLRARAGRRAK